MAYNLNRNNHNRQRQEQDPYSIDAETHIKNYKQRVPLPLLRSLHSIDHEHQEKSPYLSLSKNNKPINYNYGNNTMSKLKNQLQTLKMDFSNFFGEEPSNPHAQSFVKDKRSITVKSPKQPQDQLEVSKFQSSKIIQQIQNIEEQNLQLKNELKRLRTKYQTKKNQFKETVISLNKKVEYLEQQLLYNQESMMDVKNQLQQQMDMIREQLTRKKDAEITLQDYGQLTLINSQLKQQISNQRATIEELEQKFQSQRKAFVFEGSKNLELGNKLQQMNSSQNRISQQNNALRKKIDDLQVKQQNLTRSVNLSVERYKKQIESFQKHNEQRMKQIYELQQTVVLLKKQVQSREYALKELQIRLSNTQKDFIQAVNYAKSLQQALYDHNNLKQYTKNIELENQHLAQIVAELEQIQKRQLEERSNMINSLQFMEVQIANINNQKQRLYQQLHQKNIEISNWKEKVEGCKSGNTMVYRQISRTIQQSPEVAATLSKVHSQSNYQLMQDIPQQQIQFCSADNRLVSSFEISCKQDITQTKGKNWIKLSSRSPEPNLKPLREESSEYEQFREKL